jgi:hypothetical protein
MRAAMRRHLVLGCLLVLAGIALLGRNLGWTPVFPLPGLRAYWPLVLLAAGLYLLFFSRGADVTERIVPGIVLSVYGLFLLPFTIGRVGWGSMGRLWGVFPGTVGVALLARYVAGGRSEHSFLIPASVLVGVAVVPLVREPWAVVHTWWPIALVLVGIGVLLTRGRS